MWGRYGFLIDRCAVNQKPVEGGGGEPLSKPQACDGFGARGETSPHMIYIIRASYKDLCALI